MVLDSVVTTRKNLEQSHLNLDRQRTPAAPLPEHTVPTLPLASLNNNRNPTLPVPRFRLKDAAMREGENRMKKDVGFED